MEIGQIFKQKQPGKYDDQDDYDLGMKAIQKYPEKYGAVAEHPSRLPKNMTDLDKEALRQIDYSQPIESQFRDIKRKQEQFQSGQLKEQAQFDLKRVRGSRKLDLNREAKDL